MSKLTETQTLILSRASQRGDRIALPLPDRLRGGAANKVIVPLIVNERSKVTRHERSKVTHPV